MSLASRAFITMLQATIVAGCTLNGSGQASAVYVRNLPPTKADVMEAVIRAHDIDHSVHWSCDNIGDWSDRTIRRQFSYLIEGLERGRRGWVETRIVSRNAPSGSYWRATVLFRIDMDGPDPFTFGADFLIRQSDGLVIPSSFTCPGH